LTGAPLLACRADPQIGGRRSKVFACLRGSESGAAKAHRLVRGAGGDRKPPGERSSLGCDRSQRQGRALRVLRYRIDTFAEIFWKDILCSAVDLSARAAAGADAIQHAVVEAPNAKLDRLSVRARHAVLRMRGFPRVLPKSDFSEVALGPGDLASLAVYEHLRDLGWKRETRALLGLWKIAASAGWLVPYEHACWVSERPDRLQVDAQGRLHSPDGPALRYRDGWCFWSWKRVEVPAWAIEHPERITI